MKIKQLKNVAILLLIALFANNSFAQKQETRTVEKVVIIKKSVESDDVNNIDKDIDININENDGIRIIKIKKDGQQLLEWEGSEIPQHVQEMLEENGIELDLLVGDDETTVRVFKNQDLDIQKFHNSNKACLGIVMSKTVQKTNGIEIVDGITEKGVIIQEIIDNSAAQDAGLKEDDVITSINGRAMKDMQDVIDALNPLEIGDNININFLRGKKQKEITSSLKACNDFSKHMDKTVTITTTTEETEKEKEPKVNLSPIQPKFDQSLELEEVEVYPNPTSDVVNINFKAEAVPTTIKIVDITGKEIYRDELKYFDGVYNNQISVKDAAKGTLLINVIQGNKQFTEKIIYK